MIYGSARNELEKRNGRDKTVAACPRMKQLKLHETIDRIVKGFHSYGN